MRLTRASTLACLLCLSLPALADNQPPSIPSGINASSSGASSVNLRWNASSDNTGVAGYNVYRNGVYYKTVFSTTSYTDNAVASGSVYRYGVVAFDAARNYTPMSSLSSVTVGASSSEGSSQNQSQDASATQPSASRAPGRPVPPGGLSGVHDGGSGAALRWSAVSGAEGYNIYRDNSYIRTVRTTSVADTGLSNGQTYRYYVTAFSASGEYSSRSAEVSVAIGSDGGAQPPNDGQSSAEQSSPQQSAAAPSSGRAPEGYRLVFSDEFRGSSLDSGKWNTRYRWGPNWTINNESQYYVDIQANPGFGHNPFELDGEHLTINAIRTPDYLRGQANGKNYLSGALTTFNKFNMRYGYVEMRARMPRGKGLWSAFWMLHQGNNDKRPEIDIVEHIGDQPNMAFNTYHWYNGGSLNSTPTYRAPGPDYTQGFHTYAVRWEPGRIIWYIDGQERNRFDNGSVANEDMYLLLNLALGGAWAGEPDGGTGFPARFTIDYIRAYSR